MLEKLKEHKKIVVIVLFILGATLAWWQSRDTEETPVEPVTQEECIKE